MKRAAGAAAVLLVLAACFGGSDELSGRAVKAGEDAEIQSSVVAGSFYPDDPGVLAGMVDRFLREAGDVEVPGSLVGIMAPHAGLRYSGPVAGYAYRVAKRGDYDTIVILAPSHHLSFPGVSALRKDRYRTPLGDVKIARELVDGLIARHALISFVEGAYAKEHSLEVQLPFIQRCGFEAPVVPLVMGRSDLRTARELAGILNQEFAGRSVLFIASSDMAHFHPYKASNRIDRFTLELIQGMDPASLYGKARGRGEAELCGLGPVLTLMELTKLRGKGTFTLLRHANSGDTAGDRNRVVGYGAGAFSIP